MQEDEPPLHIAVLNDDYDAVLKLGAVPLHRDVKNALGFTALEIAHFLGKERSVKILQPENDRRIAVVRRGTTHSKAFTTDEFKNFFFLKYCAYPYFPDYAYFKEVLKNCPWMLSKTWFGSENRSLAALYHTFLEKGQVAHVEVRWIDDELGYGLFTTTDLEDGTFVGEFTGRVKPLSCKSQSNIYCFHYPTRFFSRRYTVVDALHEGNETRFINHSDRPNLEPLCLCDRNLLRIVFITKGKVAKGTQLTYNYGPDFWRSRKKIEI